MQSLESLSNSIGYKRSVFILLPILFSEALFVHVTIISYFVYHGRFFQLFTTSGVGFTIGERQEAQILKFNAPPPPLHT